MTGFSLLSFFEEIFARGAIVWMIRDDPDLPGRARFIRRTETRSDRSEPFSLAARSSGQTREISDETMIAENEEHRDLQALEIADQRHARGCR